ncbi:MULTISPECIES: LysM peptidoglycan-binding domain-containing protein [Mumia]|uniref:LysM peptidoglycan-binding domain-containing protein n=1 Tax=Mumia TaxID=1546255 RepID=UPI0014237B49|nr:MULTISPECIES: LysM peptidoglycan-binding domain-containing protein [unclassified Mumia]QMW65566.1 hypothetical protein H4N58_15445 [Mumia sp. ZJ1417]
MLRTGAVIAVPWGALLLLAEQVPPAVTRLAGAAGPAAPRLDVLVGDLGLVVATFSTGWLALLTIGAAVCRVSGHPLPRVLLRLSPGPWRRVILAVAGSSLVLAGPAAAVTGAPGAPGEPAGPRAAQVPGSAALRGLALPDRPAALRPASSHPVGQRPAAGPVGRSAARSGATHRVRAGDSLWEIAAASWEGTGAEPTTGQLDREWRRWYAANRARIGADPDALRIGMILRAPSSRAANRMPDDPRP